jgi:phosphatidylserine decarboxylase
MSKNDKRRDSLALRFLYKTVLGRIVLKLLCARFVSKFVGWFLDSRLSKILIPRFVKKNGINLQDFYSDDFSCFNDCFSRKIKDGKRNIEMNDKAFISPCDSLVSAYEISDSVRLSVKGSEYSISDLLDNSSLAEKFRGGYALVYRLCVNHYHRYIYFDSGEKGENTFISGKLHTVRPIALETVPVFAQNSREYTVMQTDNFGTAVQIEVGALLVGKIKNYHGKYKFKRAEEKGTFLYGGSTIILLLEKDRVKLREDILSKTEQGEEVPVLMGECLGYSIE